MGMIDDSTAQRFWSHVTKTAGGCWIWDRIQSDGYGDFCGMNAHRFLWIHILGRDEAEDMDVHHKCECKSCVRPDHLECLTRKDHLSRHPRHPGYTLTPAEQLQAIKWVLTGEKSKEEVAWLLGLDCGTIREWTRGHRVPNVFLYDRIVPSRVGGNISIRTNDPDLGVSLVSG